MYTSFCVFAGDFGSPAFVVGGRGDGTPVCARAGPALARRRPTKPDDFVVKLRHFRKRYVKRQAACILFLV